MSTDRFEVIRRIAAEALAVAPGQRAAVIARLCGRDGELRREVERLVKSQDAATIAGAWPSAPAESSAHRATPSAGETSGPGTARARSRRFGAYAILDTLGEGGMGVVYLAEQDKPKRAVALKVIRPGAMTAKMLRRFELESQVLGRLQHPGIAQIFEAGVASGEGEVGAGGAAAPLQPFFAMEFVRGVALTDYARVNGQSVRDRLSLFIKVCDAVQHAHQKGVIHRDLKPSNILVDRAGQPKILDFGVARATDTETAGIATLNTEAGQLVGTVPYMSPEQINGDPHELDTRSDVYTLGVILYELLAGRLPHEVTGKTIIDAARVIGEQDAAPLGRFDRAFRGDLQTIVSKALEREKSRRYQSAAELSADLGRFLRDEPIMARPPTRAYLLRKFARRNRALVVGASVAAMLLAAGAAGTLWQAVRATRGWERAKIEAENAEATSGFLSTMLESVDPDNAVGRQVSVREVLDGAARNAETELKDRPRVEWSVRKTLAKTFNGLDVLDESERHARRAMTLATEQFGAEDPHTIETARVLAATLANAGKLDEAEQVLVDALATVTRAHGKEHADACLLMSELARVYQESGRFKEARPLMAEAIEIGKRVRGEHDPEVLVMIHNLATALKDNGELDEAERLLRQVVELRSRHYGREHPQTAYSINNLAAVLQKLEKYDEAISLMREALAIRERTLGPNHQSTITTRMNLAVCLISLGRLDEGEPLVRQSVEAYEKVLGPTHAKTLIGMANLAYVLEDRKKLDEAEVLYRRIVEIRRVATGGRDPETWSSMNNLAMLVQQRGKLEEADSLFKELLGLCEASLAPDHYYTAIFRNNYADLLIEMKRYEEAERALLASHPGLEARFGATHARVTKSRARFTKLYEEWGKPEKATPFKAPPSDAVPAPQPAK